MAISLRRTLPLPHKRWFDLSYRMLLRKKFVSGILATLGLGSNAMMSSNSQKTGALVFLHGLGDTPAGWSSMLQSQLPALKPKLGDILYVFPPSPTVSITINGGAKMPGWFDLYDWPIEVGAKDDREGKLKAVAIVEEYVQKIEKEHNIPRDRIVVGGFSQGGAIALLNAYHQSGDKTPFAGCASLSAWLTLVDDLKVPEEVAKKTPLFWGHGRRDDKVLFEHQDFGTRKLVEQGVHVEDSSYP